MRGSIRLVAPFGAAAAVVVVLIVGVTGSLAALGDTLFPASSLGAALVQDFSSTSGWLVRWRWTHPTVAFVASIFLIWLLVRAAQRSTRTGTIAASPPWCFCCWPRNMCWEFWTSCCLRRCGCRWRICSARTRFGPLSWSSPRGSRCSPKRPASGWKNHQAKRVRPSGPWIRTA